METIRYETRHLKTVSLFSGAGGMDLGFLNAGFDIVWANDFDKYAVESYRANIGDHIIHGDIMEIWDTVPSHDVLLAGFPCQPFSLMGKQRGFEDERGTLFFYIEKLISKHKPKVVILENVKGLEKHDGGKTFKKMKSILKDKLNYKVYYKVLNTADYGIPQTRRRLFIVCFRDDNCQFEFPNKISQHNEFSVKKILDKEVDRKYFLSEKILPTILSHGTGGYYSKSEIDLDIARPLCSTMHKMHRASQDNYFTDNYNRGKFSDEEKPISNVRRLTPNECRKLQGFPTDWLFVVSDTQSYRQFGNAVTVDVAYYIAMKIVESLGIGLNREVKKNERNM